MLVDASPSRLSAGSFTGRSTSFDEGDSRAHGQDGILVDLTGDTITIVTVTDGSLERTMRDNGDSVDGAGTDVPVDSHRTKTNDYSDETIDTASGTLVGLVEPSGGTIDAPRGTLVEQKATSNETIGTTVNGVSLEIQSDKKSSCVVADIPRSSDNDAKPPDKWCKVMQALHPAFAAKFGPKMRAAIERGGNEQKSKN